MAAEQRWEIVRDGRTHVLVSTPTSWSRVIVWTVDGEEVARSKGSEARTQLVHEEWALDVRFTELGKGRRVTLHEGDDDAGARAAALAGLGGVDLVPEQGSPAAKHEQWVRDHPRLHTLRATAGGVGKVVVPLLVAYLLARITFSVDIPWPDLPRLPLPDLPDLPEVPWPDLPSIPWPDWSLPGWVQEVLDVLKLLVPVLIAVAVARGEIRRRRKQDELLRGEAGRPGDEHEDRDRGEG